MGSQVCRAVGQADDMTLVAAVDLGDAREDGRGASVVVDFTHPDSVMENIRWCIANGIDMVVGTTGFTEARVDQVRGWLAETPERGVILASNFSIGAALMMKFSEQAARFYDGVEIVELHHNRKAEAPSGTSRSTAERISRARAQAQRPPMSDATVSEDAGARGTDQYGVRVHSVRLPGLVAHQEVLFGSAGETLTIRHDSMDRASFMPGVLTAIRAVAHRPGLTLGIDELLGL